MKKILVIDDFATARRYHALLLRNLGHEVVEAENGREALTRVGQQPIDLIVLDLLMPELSGEAFLETLRQDSAHRHIPVIAVTSERQVEVAERLKQQGVSVVLVKPVPPAQLQRSVETAIGKLAS